ncbi:MAG: hypothetical protein WCG75_01025 [Armatimonadota bacterium]
MVSALICAVSTGFSNAHVSMIPRVQGLPSPHPLAISADGKTIVGQFAPGFPFTCRSGVTARFKPSSNPNILDQFAQGVSANGKVIVGKANGAYIWVKSKGLRSIGGPSTYAFASSEDGSVVACQEEGRKDYRGYLWSASGTLKLETFAPTCLSGDGKVAAGIRTEHGSVRAFHFHNQVSEELPLPEEFTDSAAYAVNKDGTCIVGNAFNSAGTFAAVWNKGAFTKLDNLAQQEAVAKAVTRDGTIIGGYAGSEAVVWTEEGKANYLELILKHAGANTAGWKFESINGISRVGDTVYLTGWGHLNGRDAGYYARFHVD